MARAPRRLYRVFTLFLPALFTRRRHIGGKEGKPVTNIEKRKRFIINVLYWAIIIGILMLFFRYLLGIIWPFFFAFLFAAAMMPAIRWLTAKCHIKHSISVALCLLIFFAVLGGAIIARTSSSGSPPSTPT